MKRIKWLFGLWLMVLVVCGSGSNVQAADAGTDSGTEASDFYWEENEDGTVNIFHYGGTDETVIVPSEIDGKLVRSIGGRAFKKCSTVKHLIISEGIINIEDAGYIYYEGAFLGCENLETVSLPNTLKTIGSCSFMECHKLKEINLPDGLISIGYNAFNECYQLSNIILPDGLTSIGEHAFAHCGSLERLVIPDSVNFIGYHAFLLSGDERIPIYGNPDAYVKTYCDKDYRIKFSCLNHPNIVDIPAVAPKCNEHGRTAGTQCTVCETYIVKPQWIEPTGRHSWNVKVDLKPTVRRIGKRRSTCTVCGELVIENIPPIPIPQKGEIVTEPKSNNDYKVTKPAMRNGTVELSKTDKTKSNVSVPDMITVDGAAYKVVSISKDAFKGNKKLKKVTIGKNVTKINANAFNGCKNLKTVTVKSTQIKTVGKNAFKGINAKAKIKVPKSKLKFYKKLFAKKGLKSTVKIVK